LPIQIIEYIPWSKTLTGAEPLLLNYPRALCVAAADYVSTSLHCRWLIPVQNSSFTLSQWNRSRGVWSTAGHVLNILGDLSHALLVLHAMFKMRMGHYIGIPTSRVSVFKLGRVFMLLMADAVATGKVSRYNVIVRLPSLPRFWGYDQPGVLWRSLMTSGFAIMFWMRSGVVQWRRVVGWLCVMSNGSDVTFCHPAPFLLIRTVQMKSFWINPEYNCTVQSAAK